ncbi:hypothetical protein GCM10020331_013840 [Ectobacillus funiculus]
MLTIEGDTSEFAFISASKQVVRSVTAPEIEFSVVGPKEAFVESIGQKSELDSKTFTYSGANSGRIHRRKNYQKKRK